MMSDKLPKHDVVLLGAGHTNAHVLRMWRMKPLPDTRLTCVSNFPFATYSGMLPGTLAGLYSPDQLQIDLVRLCAAAGARLVLSDRVGGLDLERRELLLDDRPPIHFDVLSIGIGSVPKLPGTGDTLPQALSALPDYLIPIKPMQTFLARLDERLRAVGPGQGQPLRVAVVGAGVAGVEIAFALPGHIEKCLDNVSIELTLIDRHQQVAGGVAARAQRLVRRELERRGVRFELGVEVERFADDSIRLNNGRSLSVDVALLATSAEAPPGLSRLGLPTDDEGFLLIRPTLQTTADAPIFVVGDSGTDPEHPHPKAGVYAVRQGPVLWKNIAHALRGEPLERYEPQSGFLKLLSTGDRRAILSYKGFAAHGGWCWRLKDWIDRRFMTKYQDYEPMEMSADPPTEQPAQMRCAGCGGKLGPSALSHVLERLEIPPADDVLVGLDAPDDAAVVRFPAGHPVAATADFFTAFVDDPYLVGRVAALNAASDLFAVGARPVAALALVGLPEGAENQQQRLLYDLLSGGLRELRSMGAALVGGHTIESEQLTIGFSMLADAGENPPRLKCGLRPGDVLLLTKPLGTGVLLAAHMQARCRADWYEQLVATLIASNQPPEGLFEQYDIQGVTDVTGFGLAGHLLEMLTASDVAAEIHLNQLPVLPGALGLIADGIESTLAPANRRAESDIEIAEALRDESACKLLFDPQTSGGLLLGVREEHVGAVIGRYVDRRGTAPTTIGQVLPRVDGASRLRISE